MEINAKQVKELRDRTNVGLMECKKALQEAKGNIDEAIKILRKKGMAKAAKKAEKEAKEGIIESYIHPGNKIGVLVELDCETDFVARTEKFHDLARKIAMHIAATNPIALSPENVDPKLIEQEKEIYKEQALAQGKPEKVVEKIVQGKMQKYYEENCLLNQPFVMDEEKTIKDLLVDAITEFGENVTIKRFSRFQIGE
ncbi:MAG: translation elongation factor Ts [Candidatus Cloacimonadia bacterium]